MKSFSPLLPLSALRKTFSSTSSAVSISLPNAHLRQSYPVPVGARLFSYSTRNASNASSNSVRQRRPAAVTSKKAERWFFDLMIGERRRRRRKTASVGAGESCCLPTTTTAACSSPPRSLLLLLLLLLVSLSLAAAAAAPLAGDAAASKKELSKKTGRGARGRAGARMSVAEALSLPTPPPPPFLSSSFSSSSSEHEQHQQKASSRRSHASPHRQEHDASATKEEKEKEQSESENQQCFPYSRTHSVAAASFRFPVVDQLTGAPTGRSEQAERGKLAHLRCDSVVCPPPAVQDCYMNEGVCDSEKEYCLLEDHVKFGPAAAGTGGRTPLVAYLDCSFFAAEAERYPWIWEQVCSNRSDWGPWTKTRGRVRGRDSFFVLGEGRRERKWKSFFLPPPPPTRVFPFLKQLLTPLLFLSFSLSKSPQPPSENKKQCVPYRKEQQSCSGSIWRPKPESKSSPSSSLLLSPQYAASTRDGRPPLRPLLCGPGLHCTGDAPPTPNTCVKARPSNVCFQGPWW